MNNGTQERMLERRDNIEIYSDGIIINTDMLSLGMGQLYMGECLTRKFLEVFGRKPTDSEYMGDWYDVDFDRLKGKI